MDVDSSSQKEASAVQVYWTPSLGCNLRVDLNNGVPEYHSYLQSASWITRRALRTVGDGGEVVYAKQRSRVFPENAPVASLKIKPENVPRHPGHQDVTAYFPHGEKAVTDLLEGHWPFCPTSGSSRRTTLDAIFSSRTSFGNTNSCDVSSAVSMRQSCQLWQLRSGTCLISVITMAAGQ